MFIVLYKCDRISPYEIRLCSSQILLCNSQSRPILWSLILFGYFDFKYATRSGKPSFEMIDKIMEIVEFGRHVFIAITQELWNRLKKALYKKKLDVLVWLQQKPHRSKFHMRKRILLYLIFSLSTIPFISNSVHSLYST